MPCDTVQTNQVALPKMHPELLKRAIATWPEATAIGPASFSVDGHVFNVFKGQLISSTADQDTVARVANQLRQYYSLETVKHTAQANGWTIQSAGAPWQFNIIKG